MVCPGSLNDADHKRTKGIYGHSALHILEDHILIFLGVISMGCIQYTAQPSCCFIGHSIYMNTGNFCRCDKSRLPFRSLIFLIVLNVYFQHFIGKWFRLNKVFRKQFLTWIQKRAEGIHRSLRQLVFFLVISQLEKNNTDQSWCLPLFYRYFSQRCTFPWTSYGVHFFDAISAFPLQKDLFCI